MIREQEDMGRTPYMNIKIYPLAPMRVLLTFLLCCFAFFPVDLWASHNLAGQITYKRLDENLYEITITTYTDPCARQVDRCFVDLEIWGVRGDNSVKIHAERVQRVNGPERTCSDFDGSVNTPNGEPIRNYSGNSCIKRNIYKTTFRFNGPGTFDLRFFDVARVQSINNINNPNNNIPIYFETRLFNQPFVGPNNSPLLLNEPLDIACTNRLWTHNPGGFDPDDDSLSYKLINCREYNPPLINTPADILGYSPPGTIGGAFSIDPLTGIITWNTPQKAGHYNFAFKVEEWRNGRMIGFVVRDMAVYVDICENNPPIITAPDSICVLAGERIQFNVSVKDPDINRKIGPNRVYPGPDEVSLYLNNGPFGNNGPFSVDQNPARFNAVVPSRPNPPVFPTVYKSPIPNLETEIQMEFVWQTDCSHLRESFYQLDLYATDDPDYSDMLTANHAVRIYVLPKAVQNLKAQPGPRKITLTWDQHTCDKVIAYEVYRAFEDNEISDPANCCESGVRGAPAGFKLLSRINDKSITTYEDKDLAYRSQYCYRIVAVFPREVKNCATPSVCERIFRDVPIIVRDSVSTTDITNGQIQVRWTPPDVTKIRADIYPPPYFYWVERKPTSGGAALQRINNDALAFEDTSYFDTDLNTEESGWTYRIVLANRSATDPNVLEEIGVGDSASSVYLSINPINLALQLIWQESVPWDNKEYGIWRSVNKKEGPYELLATVTDKESRYKDSPNTHTWRDNGEGSGLEVDTEYFYFIRSLGEYTLDKIDNLINDSNIESAFPIDTFPPCLPEDLVMKEDCERYQVNFSWAERDLECAPDLDYITLYYAQQPEGPFYEIKRTQLSDDEEINFDNSEALTITGCYRITATDFIGNKSKPSETFCVNNCPLFTMPNIFTPNGDGINDILSPMLIRSISEINFSVFDRWGILIHQTTDRMRLWDGLTGSGGEAVEGQYFYVAELTMDNLKRTKTVKTGSFTLMR